MHVMQTSAVLYLIHDTSWCWICFLLFSLRSSLIDKKLIVEWLMLLLLRSLQPDYVTIHASEFNCAVELAVLRSTSVA